ncbi:DNA-formamidopyrimidine glycosylase family protein [Kiritimatiellota bacterium B12222]|nr:DNA-formamidopyrimidine glycosylase family protein [Kiritimatiellota bacterium B12222]
MPELPEVETWRRLAQKHAVGKKISQAFVADDSIVFDRNDPTTLPHILEGRSISATHRKGKHCWLSLDNGQDLYLHFGMTGSLHWLPDLAAEPSHIKLRLHLSDGSHLSYRNLRRIGRVRLLDDVTALPPVSLLGPDPLEDDFSVQTLQSQLSKRKAPIKAILLDQKVFAGVGNWIADEVLYAMKLNPHTSCASLDPTQIQELRSTLLNILTQAVDLDADASRFPKDWLFHYRWGKKATSDAQGASIQFDQIGGRTTAWVP